MAKPNLTEIEERLKNGELFSLTDAQYTKKTGLALPKEKNYLIKRSALAKLCKKYGYSLSLTEKRVSFEKED